MSMKQFFVRIGVFNANRRGAALPEFAIAILPLITVFFVLVQVGELFIGHLLLHHGAVVAARCAVVSQGPDLPGKYVDGDGAKVCKDAAIAGVGVGSWYKGLTNIKTQISYSGNKAHDESQYADVTTTTSADFKCGVPLGERIICPGGTRTLSFTILLPHEGALYTLDSDYNGS